MSELEDDMMLDSPSVLLFFQRALAIDGVGFSGPWSARELCEAIRHDSW